MVKILYYLFMVLVMVTVTVTGRLSCGPGRNRGKERSTDEQKGRHSKLKTGAVFVGIHPLLTDAMMLCHQDFP